MLGRTKGTTAVASDALDTASPYFAQLASDKKLRRQLTAAVGAAVAARRRARRRAGLLGAVAQLASDPVLRIQVIESAVQLQRASRRMKKRNASHTKSHTTRNVLLLVIGAGAAAVASPKLRSKVVEAVRGVNVSPGRPSQASIEEQIEVNVPVRTAYNQWTQFEEFPKFMEGVDEVKQLDDTLLHWAVTVAGTRAEWDAKITQQDPDRRIAWESVDGKETRGMVTFEPAGSGSRTRVRLQMYYTPEGVGEAVGSAVGLDQRRVRADLERFRELIESRQKESGGWRGEIKNGQKEGSGSVS
jgi:uncharacterized membrane protein